MPFLENQSRIMKVNRYILFLCLVPGLASCSKHEKDSGGTHDHVNFNDYLSSISVDSFENPVDVRDLVNQSLAYDSLLDVYFPKRTDHLTKFPCTSCHTVGLETLQKNAIGSTHNDITLENGVHNSLDCKSCHNLSDLNTLSFHGEAPISMDNAYNLCASCHSTQYKDWKGGAHGKRLGGWGEPIVKNSCVDCHNPHSPAFPKRWPSRLTKSKQPN